MAHAQNPTHHHTGHVHADLINMLLDCALACERCMATCLEEKDVTRMAHCIELDRDCAEVCFLGAKLLLEIRKLPTRIYWFASKRAAYAPKSAAFTITSTARNAPGPAEGVRKPATSIMGKQVFHNQVAIHFCNLGKL